ncbi:hypothetical protein EXIGLDRAFT_702411 [Exidia glandulosa HHB12029]|uniref:Uncharacterized protein n=1 Tax=Exidia glandulosa HHB12029 TaxID=1314781 RepID=A0A165CJ85_EXIGL|nr:hypothetical protein EXIGLDRAFT_702411 [Exidia glandulosa HHB12029]
MAPKRRVPAQVQFASEPEMDLSGESQDGHPESPTRRKSKDKQAAKKKAVPRPPQDPPAAIPRPATRATAAKEKLAATAPAAPKKAAATTKSKAKASARPLASIPPPATPKRNARVHKPSARSPARVAPRKKAAQPAKKAPRAPPAANAGRGDLLRRMGLRAQNADEEDDEEELWEDEEDVPVDSDNDRVEDDVDEDMEDAVDDDDGYVSPTDDMLAGGRSDRYRQPRVEERMDEDDDDAFVQPTRGGWRKARRMRVVSYAIRVDRLSLGFLVVGSCTKRAHPLRSSVASVTDVISPVRKKQPAPANWARFVKGYTVDPQMALIPECVKVIVGGGFVQYLPLHMFAPEILAGEAATRLALRPEESILSRVIQPRVPETDMDPQSYMTWSKKALLAFKVLGVPEHIRKMFEDHFDCVQTAEDFLTEWLTWRLYDLRRRALVMGDNPADISTFDSATFRQCQNAVLAEMNLQMRATLDRANRVDRRPVHAASSNAQASTSRGASSSKVVSKAITAKYSRCLSCGSNTHVYEKDTARDDCDTKWLVFDKVRGAWRTPDTRALVCWAYNSVDGCKKDKCRFERLGHRCTLCGGSHGCHDCKA